MKVAAGRRRHRAHSLDLRDRTGDRAQRSIPACALHDRRVRRHRLSAAPTTPPTAPRSYRITRSKALEERTGCLLANHGVIATGANLDKAMWLAVELETIAKQYYYALMLGGPNILCGRADRGDAQGLRHLRAAGSSRDEVQTRRRGIGRHGDLGTVDLLVIGGGVNGAASPATPSAAASSVVLCEKGDLASGTLVDQRPSSIHGGLRYLEYYEFRLVREALIEREVLLDSGAAHHLARCASCCRTRRSMRPAWMVRLGLFLYDHLGGHDTAPTGLSTHQPARGARRPASSGRVSARASNTPTAGSMMPGSWC